MGQSGVCLGQGVIDMALAKREIDVFTGTILPTLKVTCADPCPFCDGEDIRSRVVPGRKPGLLVEEVWCVGCRQLLADDEFVDRRMTALAAA